MRRTDRIPERILIVSLDNLGDLVFTSALTTPLRNMFPDAAIDVWCREYASPVARLIPHIGNVVSADPFWARQPHIAAVSPRQILRSIGTVRGARYDVAIVTGAPWRTTAAVALTRIPVRVGAARPHNRHFLTHVVPAEDVRKPVVQEQARLLRPLGARSENPHYQLDPSRFDPRARAALSELPPRFVALHPFASQRDRCVPLVEWVRIAFELHAHDVPVVWIGMPHELEELRRSFTHPVAQYVDCIGDGSLHTTAAVLSRASLFVGHDSGPLHVAAAFGVPVIGVFAPGQPERTFPQGPGPWRMIHHPNASGINARSMLYEIEELGLFSTT
ncbi:MAG TPA: glycosyltransferase family 9 protein [Gemmatimonadaceae bacterium]|jgi:ADP-heptose:LPS heptosyltransferase